MPGEMSRGRLVQRLITFYAILAVIAVAVVIFVVDKGGSEKAQPAIAGGYTASTPSPCIGPVPKPVGGTPLPATAPAQAAATGPSFNVLQSGQFVNFTNNQGTLGGKLRLNEKALPGNAHRLTGNVGCVNGKSLSLDAIAVPGAKGAIKGTLGGVPFAAALKSAPPAPGAAAPRTPSNIQGTFALSPSSTCFGSSFSIHGTGAVATLYSASGKNLGPAHLLEQDGRSVRGCQVRQGRDRAADRDRQRHPAAKRHRDPPSGGDPRSDGGPERQAGADHPVGSRSGR